ncbi:MAG: ATP-binding protein [Candidatus Aminicenantes bacterium]|nr:ATP-binding protein [Candidatus Aminicenantes bacterium]
MKNSTAFLPNPDFSITILSQTQLLKMVVELTRHITTLSNFPLADAQKISLAIDEAVTNVIKHSYNNVSDREIRLDYFLGNSGIRIRIFYRGRQPDISDEEVNIKNMIKSKKKGGLGVKLMRTIMDSVTYSTEDGQHCCEMIKWRQAK